MTDAQWIAATYLVAVVIAAGLRMPWLVALLTVEGALDELVVLS